MAAPHSRPQGVLPARSIDEFLADPRDRYIARRNFCYWQLGTRYKGCIVWGRPNEQDAREMIRTFETGVRLDHARAPDVEVPARPWRHRPSLALSLQANHA